MKRPFTSHQKLDSAPHSRPSEDITNRPSPISAAEYHALSDADKAAYRPVNPRYEHLPRICLVLYVLAAICLGLYIAMHVSVSFSDGFNRTVSAALRTVLATLTSPIPFSLGEFILWMLPLILFFVLRHAIRRRCDTWRSAIVYVGILLSVVVTLFSAFVLTFAAGYRGSSLSDKLELEDTPVSATELYDTAVLLIDRINAEAAEMNYATDGFSVMPYSLSEMNGALGDAYTTFAGKHDFISHTPSRVKPVLLSEAMSYMHITGVYSFFTGEANINVNFPAYTIPYTAAHELAHQRGIAREDEANFVAFLVCIGSDDPYIRYSGYLNLYEYVANALWSADPTLYYKAVANLDSSVKREMVAYNDFFETYKESVASEVSGTVNNTFLQSQGTPGTKSYGMVVDLAVAYYRD